MPPSQTRSLYTLDSTLQAWAGVGVYRFDARQGTTSPLPTPPSGHAFNFLEVAVVDGQGSWWLPTTLRALVPEAWLSDVFGGIENLEVDSRALFTRAGGQNVMRPVRALWWIPEATLGGNREYVPGIDEGRVLGRFPTLEPAGTPVPPCRPCPPARSSRRPCRVVLISRRGARRRID